MGFLAAVKETVVGDDEIGTEVTNDRERSVSSVEGDRPASNVEAESEADLVVATGRTREELLLDLVETHDGRIKQAELVDRTGWSKSTVSRYLSALEREGAIDRIHVGRCKVVLLPDDPLLNEHGAPERTVSHNSPR